MATQTCIDDLPSMDALLQQHTLLEGVRKIGEGTFGEAFKGDGVVFKIVPMEGDTLVNGEAQKRAGEIMAEALIALRLSGLRAQEGVQQGAVRCILGVCVVVCVVPCRPKGRCVSIALFATIRMYVSTVHYSNGFVHTHCVGVCRGVYSPCLLTAWHDWDAVNTSENEAPNMFGEVCFEWIFVLSGSLC